VTSRPAAADVVVTGVGIISAAGLGADDAWRRLRSDPPRPEPYADDLTRAAGRPPFPVFRVRPHDSPAVGLPERARQAAAAANAACAADLRYLIEATAAALLDAALPLDCEDADPPVALVVADESPGLAELSGTLMRGIHDGTLPASPLDGYTRFEPAFFNLNTFLPPHYLARAFGCAGTTLFVNSACASGLSALDVAAQTIRSGRSAVAIVAAADHVLSGAKFLWFAGRGFYADDGVLRPFDARQRGTVFGEGGAALVLESAASAGARGARAYASYSGGGFAQDGWKVTAPAPTKLRGEQAVRAALREAGTAIEDIDVFVPHGMGTAASDQYEARLLRRLFPGASPAITALKPYVGHNLGGSALMETALLLLAMAHEEIPPTPNHDVPLRRDPVALVREWRPARISTAVKLTCAFGGFYAAAVFQRPPAVAARGS
jgi:3-oxoacyl-(acyl-carrier-protein) synthase